MADKVQEQEEKVDAAITGTQGALERLKNSPHSAWILLLVVGLIVLAVVAAIVVT